MPVPSSRLFHTFLTSCHCARSLPVAASPRPGLHPQGLVPVVLPLLLWASHKGGGCAHMRAPADPAAPCPVLAAKSPMGFDA